MKFEYSLQENWPPLAWLARLKPGKATVLVMHGPAVESRPDWFCECVWDSRYSEGGFDQTDIVAGTGGRLRGDVINLVSSGSTVDRIQYLEHDGAFWVSNSIVCLAATLGASFDPVYPHYLRDFISVIRGLGHYVRTLTSSLGPVSLAYFNNLCWNGERLQEIAKPEYTRDFSSFESYTDFLKTSLERIAGNMGDEERQHQYSFLGTLSTGYDSTTVTALARPFGLSEVLCFQYADGRDRGSEMATTLGVRPATIQVNEWREMTFPEIPFLSVNGFGEEVQYAAAGSRLQGRVLLTGYHGDKVWDRNTTYTGPDIIRGDISGTALSEYRLWTQFIHCPVPFWGVRQIRDIVNISRDPALAPWDVGGDYTRPICRRIVESAGVARQAFGMVKSMASRWYVQEPNNLTPESAQDYFQFLTEHRGDWWRRLRIPPSRNRSWDNAKLRALRSLSTTLIRMPGWYRLQLNRWPVLRGLSALGAPNPPYCPMVIGTRRYYFPWAVERCKKRYQIAAGRE